MSKNIADIFSKIINIKNFYFDFKDLLHCSILLSILLFMIYHSLVYLMNIFGLFLLDIGFNKMQIEFIKFLVFALNLPIIWCLLSKKISSIKLIKKKENPCDNNENILLNCVIAFIDGLNK